MKCLFLDLASHHGLIAYIQEDKALSSVPCDHRIGDHELIPMVESVLSDAGTTYQDLSQIACIVGPGGFTSLRVGVAYANVMADQLNIPVAGIHLSDLYRARTDTDEFLWLHSTKKQELIARTFGSDRWTEPTHLTLEEFAKQVPTHLSWAGELIEEHQKVIDEKGLSPANLKEIGDVLPNFLKTLSYKKELLLPWYGRGW